MEHGHDPGLGVAENYLAFAEEARGRSPAYESLAASVAQDGVVLGFLGSLPPDKRQPNLLFAAARYLLGGTPDPGGLRDLASRGRDELAGVLLARRTQTNEPARCATLLPALALLPRPLALIEVDASAGLTLLFDRYSYDYAGHRITGSDPAAPVLRSEPHGPVPLPDRVPEITWRAGLDLNPLDVSDDDEMRWLSCLVWPGEGDREQRLAAAVATARRSPRSTTIWPVSPNVISPTAPPWTGSTSSSPPASADTFSPPWPSSTARRQDRSAAVSPSASMSG